MNNFSWIALTLIFMIISRSVSGQYWFEGDVHDDQGRPITAATVTARLSEKSTVIAFAISGPDGVYHIGVPDITDSLLLEVSALGFESNKYWIGERDTMSDPITRSFVLKRRIISLKEVIVKSSISKPIVNGDTVTFTADGFRDHSEKIAEDLLKKIPGVDVAKDGTISINGRRIKKILIEGDDLVGNGYSMLSRNLSAQLIDKIQIIARYTEQTPLKGMIDADDKVLNIILKNEQKRKAFGNIVLGAGNNDKYDLAVNLLGLSPHLKIMGIGGFNTIGRELRPDVSQDKDEELPFHSQNKEHNLKAGLIDIIRSMPSEFDRARTNSNQAKLASLSLLAKPTSKLQLKVGMTVLGDKNRIESRNDYTYLLPDSLTYLHETDHYNQNPLVALGNLDLKFTPSKKMLLQYLFNGKISMTGSNAFIDANYRGLTNYNEDSQLEQSHKINFISRWNPKSVLLFNVEYGQQLTTQHFHYSRSDSIIFPILNRLVPDLFQSFHAPQTMARIRLKNIYGNAINQIAFEAGSVLEKDQIISSLDTLNLLQRKEILSDSFTNRYSVQQQIYYLTLSGLKKLGRFTFLAELSLKSLFVKTNQIQTTEVLYHFNYAVPKISIKWAHQDQNIWLGYSFDRQLPDISRQLSGYILTDYRTLRRGADLYSISHAHTVFLNYAYSDWTKKIMIYANVTRIVTTAVQSNRYLFLENFDLIMQTRGTGTQKMLLFFTGIDKFIPIISSSIKLKSNFFTSSYSNQVNNFETRKVYTANSSTELSLRSAWHGSFNFHIGSTLNNRVSKILTQQSSLHNSNFQTFATVNLTFCKKLTVQLNGEHYYFGSVHDADRSYLFLDCSMHVDLSASKLSFVLRGQNLLNNKMFLNSSISDLMIETQRYRLISRYAFGEVSYRF